MKNKEEKKTEQEMVECNYRGTLVKIPLPLFLQMAFRTQHGNRKFVRYKEGPELYSVSPREFYNLAHDAGAIYKRGKMVLINTEIVDDFLESYRE